MGLVGADGDRNPSLRLTSVVEELELEQAFPSDWRM